MADEFASAPQSIAEIRAHRSQDAKDWKPRDVLISVLRDIDSGEIAPDALVVVHRTVTKPGTTDSAYEAASPDLQTSLGLLAQAQHQMLRQTD